LWLLCGSLLFASCDVEDVREVCDYSLQLRYSYNEENTSQVNRFDDHISHLDELIFDEQGILVSMRRLEGDECTRVAASETTLPPGRYSVIAVGNRDDRSDLRDEATGGEPVVGQTHREDVRLSLENAEMFDDETRGHCEELFHGYRTFTIREQGISRVRVDMINAHFELGFRVTWKNSVPVPGVYYAVLENIPSEYRLMPEWFYPAGSFDALLHEPDTHDEHPHIDDNVLHHIPHTTHLDNNVLSHSNTTSLNSDGEVWGKFVNYRIKTATEPVMTLYFAADGVRSGSDTMMFPREIKLKDYFAWVGLQLDQELKQEYILDIVIDGDQIIISPFENFGVADWTEGGILN
jgi:hypothetical protein